MQNGAMLDRSQIPYAHWQLRRDPDGHAVLGAIAPELDCLKQEIRQCILTPKGSVPLNPEKGCDLQPYMDRPMNIRHLFVVAEVRAGLERDVPRINVQSVEVDASFAHLQIQVTWSPKEWVSDEFIVTEVSLGN